MNSCIARLVSIRGCGKSFSFSSVTLEPYRWWTSSFYYIFSLVMASLKNVLGFHLPKRVRRSTYNLCTIRTTLAILVNLGGKGGKQLTKLRLSRQFPSGRLHSPQLTRRLSINIHVEGQQRKDHRSLILHPPHKRIVTPAQMRLSESRWAGHFSASNHSPWPCGDIQFLQQPAYYIGLAIETRPLIKSDRCNYQPSDF